jgi:peptidoglycan/LPS O-acetylase OafA/YrhL
MPLSKVVNTSVSHGKSELVRVDYLDGWRGLAIALVLQSHFFAIAGLNSGDLGVDIFLVLSGFLMSRILFVKRVPLATFYKRRISRIFPVFILFVSTIYGVAYFLGGYDEVANFFYTITFLRTYLLAFTVNHLSEVPRFIQLVLATSAMRLLGIWSYSLYLWQHPFYKLKDYFGTGFDLLALLLAMFVGVLSFYLYENPTRTWLNKVW